MNDFLMPDGACNPVRNVWTTCDIQNVSNGAANPVAPQRFEEVASG
jgi:hypothetical protein